MPTPDEQGDLERLREQELLREFQDYRTACGRLKQFRTEAVRAGFKAAFSARDYQAILNVAAKLPETVLQEDDKLLMYYDAASTRVDG